MGLAMLVPLITITIKKVFTRPTPRELREIVQSTQFNFSHNYNMTLFFFTIALVYSAMSPLMSPLILPFTLVYFTVAGYVHKYMFIYVHATKVENGGKVWPVLFRMVMASVLFFQLIMIMVLKLKGGLVQVYSLIPLLVLTLLYQYAHYKRRRNSINAEPTCASTIDENSMESEAKKNKDNKSSPAYLDLFKDPVYTSVLPEPTIHRDVQDLLKDIKGKNYKSFEGNDKLVTQDIDLEKGKESHLEKCNEFHIRNGRCITLHGPGFSTQIASLTEAEIVEDDRSYYGQAENQDAITSDPSMPFQIYPTYSFYQKK
jgi:hypothetical protein